MASNRFYYLILFFFPLYLHAQLYIKGRLVDRTNKAIETAEISILKTDGALVKSGFSDASGGFFIKLEKPDNYLFKVQYLNDVLHEITIDLKSSMDLGTLALQQTISLETISIKAQKKIIEQKPDRMVFNVENIITANSGNGLNALKKAPGVQIVQDKIYASGKEVISIMVEDKPLPLSGKDLLDYVKTLSADEIKSIELIHSPPSKYDASGSGSIINIKRKKGRKNAWSNSTKFNYQQGYYPTFSLNNTFFYDKNKLSVSLTVTLKKEKYVSDLESRLFYPNRTLDAVSKITSKRKSFRPRLSLDYKPTDKMQFGIAYAPGFSSNNGFNIDVSRIYKPLTNGMWHPQSSTNSFNDSDRKSHALNLYFSQKLDSLGSKISVDLDYFGLHKNDKGNLMGSLFDDKPFTGLLRENSGTFLLDNYSARLDVAHHTNWAILSYGTKWTVSKTKIHSKDTDFLSVDDQNQKAQNDFRYNEAKQAIYIDALKNLWKRWQVKVGLRLENAQTKGISKLANEKQNKVKHLRLFPSFYLQYTHSPENSFNVSYNQRIQRPGFWALNPFIRHLSPTTSSEGNPLLRPSYTHEIALGHNYKNKLFSRLSLSKLNDGFGQVALLNPENNKQLFKQLNYFNMYGFSISETFSWTPTVWWQSSYTFSLSYNHLKSVKDLNLNLKQSNGMMMFLQTNNQFMLNASKTLSAALDFFYSPPGHMEFGRFQSIASMDIGFNAHFLKKKLQIGLVMKDIFKGDAYKIQTNKNHIKERFLFSEDTRQFGFNISYLFGNNLTNKTQRKTGNEEEKNRSHD